MLVLKRYAKIALTCMLFTIIIAPLSILTFENTFKKSTEISFQEHLLNKRYAKNTTHKDPHKDICIGAKTCSDCVGITKFQCLWCIKDERCMPYPTKSFVPQTKDCSWVNARWGVCWLDFRALVIAVSIIVGILVLIVCCCIVRFCKCLVDCCHICKFCCCFECFEERRAANREANQLRKLEKKLENQAKRHELMLKYGTQRPSGVAFGSTGNYRTLDNTSI